MPANQSPATEKKTAKAAERTTAKRAAKGGLRGALSDAVPGCDADIGILMFVVSRIGRINELFAGLATREFSVAEWLVLTVLLMEGAPYRLSPTALAARVVQTAGGMTKTLQRLEDKGLIVRVRAEEDRRAFLVELTTEGRKTTQRHLANTMQHYGELVEGIPATGRRAIMTSLRALLDAFEHSTGVARTAEWLK